MLLLLTTICAAVLLYGHPPALLGLALAVAALVSFAAAMFELRMHLIVDDYGVAVRYLGRESWILWHDIRTVRVVSGVRGAQTVRVERVDRSYVDVPPSLLMPGRPVTKPTAEALLRAVVAQVESRRSVAPRDL
jgi:hypothetical protein